jgi:2-hydroxychromene-2-carboxylate isomerase
VRSTTKLWNPTLASQAILFAKARNRLWEFCDPVLAAFWRREFDLESPAEVEAALVNAGLSPSEWSEFLQRDAERALAGALEHAERLGVFGAPTFIYRGEMFWGGDRMDLLESAILDAPAKG